MNEIKNYLKVILEFTTGLGFYGLGLLAAAMFAELFFGWTMVAAGLTGAFIYKNYGAIVEYVKSKLK